MSYTWEISAKREVRYGLSHTRDVLNPHNESLAAALGYGSKARRLVIVDHTVDLLYGDRIRQYLAAHHLPASVIPLPVDESSKNIDSLLTVVRAADDAMIRRRSEPIIAIGGGVLTDIVGLAASLYRRGTPFIRVPTTLVGLIDAAVGVKTAVNFGRHKNRLGTYHPASHSLLDPTFLATLEKRHIRSGIAEIIKVAVMCDALLFDLLEHEVETIVQRKDFVEPRQEALLRRAVSAIVGELEPNLWEDDLQRVLDFGHTFSPSLEMSSGLLHGEVVAVDMALSSVVAHHRGLLDEAELERLLRLLDRAGLPIIHPLCTESFLWSALQEATRHRDGAQQCPLPTGIGQAVFVNDLSRDELAAARRRLAGSTRPLAAGRHGRSH